MAVGLNIPDNLLPIAGIRLGTAAAGIKYPDRQDLLLIEISEGSHSAAVFTQNAFCAAPVQVARANITSAATRYLLVNSGNANAGLGAEGITCAKASCDTVAKLAGCDAKAVLPFSTGVIGETFPVERLEAAIPDAIASLKEDAWLAAAEAIMTTDTIAKGVSERCVIDGKTITITGIVKGAGMIRPDMATLLTYIGTDANVAPEYLQACLKKVVGVSFNRITVDGDTSTNDSCVLMATGAANNSLLDGKDKAASESFEAALEKVFIYLAQAAIRDAEGVTKLLTIDVESGADESECNDVAYTIAHSPLVKTALFAADPNWGRILAAIGRAGVADLNINALEIYLDDVCIVRSGARANDYTEEAGQHVMDKDEITLTVKLGRGSASTRVWTCDLSYDYVKINAEYRS